MVYENFHEIEIRRRPKIAVCLAAYNGVGWLAEQIESILNQVGVDVTIFISADLSSDGTLEYISLLADGDSRIRILPYGERFGGAAKNFFRLLVDVDFESYEYVSLSDQDDIWREGKLARAVQVLEETRAYGYSSNVTAFWDNGRSVFVDKSQPQREWDFLFEAAGPGCTYVIRSSLAREIKQCLLANSELIGGVGLHDWFIYAFARARKMAWVIDEFDGMLYRQHSNNQVGVNRGLRAYTFRARKVLGGWGFKQACLIARLIGLENDPFVRGWKKMGRMELFWLAFKCRKCRRRSRDQVFFFLLCVALSAWNPLG